MKILHIQLPIASAHFFLSPYQLQMHFPLGEKQVETEQNIINLKTILPCQYPSSCVTGALVHLESNHKARVISSRLYTIARKSYEKCIRLFTDLHDFMINSKILFALLSLLTVPNGSLSSRCARNVGYDFYGRYVKLLNSQGKQGGSSILIQPPIT